MYGWPQGHKGKPDPKGISYNTIMSRLRFYSAALFLALALAGGARVVRGFLSTLPNYATLEEYTPSLITRVYDVHGEQLAAHSITVEADLQPRQRAVQIIQLTKECGVCSWCPEQRGSHVT